MTITATFPTVVDGVDGCSAAWATLSGTSGIIENEAKVSKAMNASDATAYANNALTTNCLGTTVFTFKTTKPGLKEGMWLPMNVPQFGLVSPMLITNFSVEDHGISDTGELYYYSITAVAGPLQMAWTVI